MPNLGREIITEPEQTGQEAFEARPFRLEKDSDGLDSFRSKGCGEPEHPDRCRPAGHLTLEKWPDHMHAMHAQAEAERWTA